jgi:ABC-type transport system involved in multi-copper enzyme maturation permease subunit
MTFLPIVERELRVAARKQSTFWLRVAAALTGLVIGAALMLLSRFGPLGGAAMGDALFSTLTWLALLAALSAGLFFTADCLSEEKREGTLGFLFLTDLRGYDVAGGKLLASSLRVAFALIAIFPVLSVSFLMGAVSGAHVWRTALALGNALFFSLAAGMMVSALSRDAQKALAATVGLLLLLILGGPVTEGILAETYGHPFKPLLSLASPGYVFVLAGAWGRSPYWLALGVSQAVGWAMLALACLLAPRTWQEKARRHRGSRLGYWCRYGGKRRTRALRRKLMDKSPVMWLVSRERWQALSLWLIALVLTGVVAALIVGRASAEYWSAWGPVDGGLGHFLLYLLAASQAGRFFVEARRSRLTELLLASPLDERQIVHGHWRAMVRLFGPPVALLLLAELVGGCFANFNMLGGGRPQALNVPRSLLIVATATGALSTLASLVALGWFGMWMGTIWRRASLCALTTLAFVKIIPYTLVWFCATLLTFAVIFPRVIGAGASGLGSGTPINAEFVMIVMTMILPALLNVLVDVGLVIWSRQRLYATFRERAARELGPLRPPPPPPAPPSPAVPDPGAGALPETTGPAPPVIPLPPEP